IAYGEKTINGYIGVDPAAASLSSILEDLQQEGFSVGLVTTVQVSHATPAAFAAHVPDRNLMNEIALQMLAHSPNVLLGGGEDEFLPPTESGCYSQPGERMDGRNLIEEAIAWGYTYVCEAGAFGDIEPATTTHLLGLFGDEGMYRPFTPSLAAMTEKAIEILSQDPDGFFLMVKGGQIDWAAHSNDAENVMADTLGLDAAVAIGLAYAQTNPNTILIVTADHETGGMSVGLTSSGLPDEDGPFSMPDGTPFYVNWTSTDHTGVDVPTTAYGVYSDQLEGSYENTYFYDVMRFLIGSKVWMPLVVR
ncbi:MAG: alkaline phosphatase, partial [Anaerolineales bacterium]|nr:alkaline phosphatase [Anaerolineales bacterium]